MLCLIIIPRTRDHCPQVTSLMCVYSKKKTFLILPIQVLRNAMGGGGVTVRFPGKIVTKVYGSTLLALREGGWVSNLQENLALGPTQLSFIFHFHCFRSRRRT